MDDAKKQLIDKLKSSNNILVTVSRDPSVDQLASCIGLTLLLNKQGKHAAAVFSGKVPSTLEFLKPEDTLEENTDSLRDFIISLDKAKADKLRYKVEEDVVRIFITPYRTSLSEADLEFTEGDFNVDVVVALGVHKQEDLDQAITAHGRILHDATVTSINTSADGGLGTINWYDPQASSLSELVTDLAQALEGDLLDEQIATALLTGIVSETGRFSNDKTSSQTMSASAALMAAGANQQLVATKLEAEHEIRAASDGAPGDSSAEGEAGSDDGILEIDHPVTDTQEKAPTPPEAPVDNSPPEPPVELPQMTEPEAIPDVPAGMSGGPKLVTEPPTMGGMLTANSQSEQLDPVTDPFSLPDSEPPRMLDHEDEDDTLSETDTSSPQLAAPPAEPTAAEPEPVPQLLKPAPPAWTPPAPRTPLSTPSREITGNATLSELEQSVQSPHVDPANLDTVRTEVNRALSGTDSTEPIEALNARPLGDDLHPVDPVPPPEPQSPTTVPTPPPDTPQVTDPTAPPPVPPPIPFQFGNSPPPQ